MFTKLLGKVLPVSAGKVLSMDTSLVSRPPVYQPSPLARLYQAYSDNQLVDLIPQLSPSHVALTQLPSAPLLRRACQ